MSSRALEIVRVLCMHMGDIIFFIAYAWPTRGDTLHAPRPPPCHLICVSFCTTHPKKKRADKKMKIRCDFWPLPGSSATLIAGNKAWHTAWNTDKHVVMPHTHTETDTVSEWSYIYAHIARQRSATHIHFSNAFLMPGNSLPALSPCHSSLAPSCPPSPARSHFHFCPAKVSTTYAILRKMQSMEDWQNK